MERSIIHFIIKILHCIQDDKLINNKMAVISTEAQRNGGIYLVRFLDCVAPDSHQVRSK